MSDFWSCPSCGLSDDDPDAKNDGLCIYCRYAKLEVVYVAAKAKMLAMAGTNAWYSPSGVALARAIAAFERPLCTFCLSDHEQDGRCGGGG